MNHDLVLPAEQPPVATVSAKSDLKIPFREALLVALAAGLGYGFDAYAVNIFCML